ncbi:hypothetical protein ACHAXR_002980 [Thalassiosira sp. AJA248-18]
MSKGSSPRPSRRRETPSTSKHSLLQKFLLFIFIPQILSPHAPPCLNLPQIATASASGILTDLVSSTYERLFPPEDYIDDDFETKTLNIVEISDMRARDIKRRLAREHGYDPDELSRMIDKKDLINVLSYEEHKAYQQEADRRKWIRLKTTVIYTCVAVLVVMFWPLLRHVLEVAHVNFVVYTDRRKHEIKRCREFNSFEGYFGILLLFIIDILSFWLSVSVLLSWVMRSKYFFPTPNIPIRPAQLLTPKGGDAGALGQYGLNVGPMIISWLFRFLNGNVEGMIGKAISKALKRQKRKEKEFTKRLRKEERAKEKAARQEARRQAKAAKEERVAHSNETEEVHESSDDENSYSGMTASNVTRAGTSNFDDLD